MSGRPPPDSPQGNLIGLRSGAWDSMYRKREMEKAGMAPINAEATMKKMYEQVIGRQLERQKLIHDAEKKSPSLVEPESDALEAQKKKKKKDVRLWRGGIELL
ncbi:hypothetical protein Pmar_PMAR025524 [Perkinsus marinus ATCC 50983]|uniref:Uncharacterized protein n=1 Tax=Perkinsus marinus (strain ATCC 50983 / TXsc) TaxID=423536 RepID=C5LZA6_PERM5|nr:hypothetical protein Pmar_PMAR025524 [Perkinsus marinus ATCC 50983]EEQ97900.1 hypothetical protein Pmar_PMAR025524 [Perkinsus marinus ATCC 50983]|eukprot:XP_002765183.1 hypothetical protein Pmar_PMAR025524 [Perkinsus marinus ATCC 50983]